MCQGTQPQKDQTLWSYSHLHPQAKRSLQAGGHLIPGECPKWCWDGGSLPRGSPHHHLSHSCDFRVQEHHPSADASQLWEKANKALEELVATKSSIDAHRQKVVWELGMELHWNDSKAAESIKEARAICTHATLDAEALCSATVKEAKATCTHTIQEAEAICSTAIRDAETQGASQADSLHRPHAKTIKHLEEQVTQEDGKSQIDFLSTCQAVLQASPAELRGTLVAAYHIFMGQAPTSHLFTLSQGASPLSKCLTQQLLLL